MSSLECLSDGEIQQDRKTEITYQCTITIPHEGSDTAKKNSFILLL
jgi:hypothetical protein